MSLLPVKTCTCTQDKKQTAGTDYDGQSLCSFKFPLQPSFGVSRSYGITLRRLRVNSSRVRTSNGEYVPVNKRHHTNWVDETRYRDKGYTHLIKKYCCRFLLLLEFLTKNSKAVHETIAAGDGNHFGDKVIH